MFGPFGVAFQAFTNIAKQDFNGVRPLGSGPEAVMAQMSTATKSAARVQLEVMGFAVRRAGRRSACKLARCRTPQDFANEQMNFWRTAMEQYIGSPHRNIREARQAPPAAMSALGATAAAPRASASGIASASGPNAKEAMARPVRLASGGARRVA